MKQMSQHIEKHSCVRWAQTGLCVEADSGGEEKKGQKKVPSVDYFCSL